MTTWRLRRPRTTREKLGTLGLALAAIAATLIPVWRSGIGFLALLVVVAIGGLLGIAGIFRFGGSDETPSAQQTQPGAGGDDMSWGGVDAALAALRRRSRRKSSAQ